MSLDFDKRVQVNTIIENQLPQFLVSDFPNATEFFKQYYLSQEFQGGPTDLIDNFDRYIKADNLVPEVIVGTTSLTSDIDSSDKTITVESTKGFPAEYGLLKINDEIITYTSKTDTTFSGCIRGFSGITGFNVDISASLDNTNKQDLVFEETNSAEHTTGSTVTNLSVLFLQEFYHKLKKTFLPGLEDNDFVEGLDVGNFIKHARSFYQSKGIAESIHILFKVLYGVDSEVLDLEERLIKPSSAEYIRREVVIAEAISGDPSLLIGQTITKSTDLRTSASVSEVEIFERNLGIGANIRKTYYKVSLFVGFSDRDLIEGTFTIPGKTKVLGTTPKNSSVITVDSTIGFPSSGILISGTNVITYTSKTVNQFLGCSGVDTLINDTDDIRANETVFGYENGDITRRVDLRITGVLSDFVPDGNISLIEEQEKIYSRNVGESIPSYDSQNIDDQDRTYKQIFANSWKYNTSSRYQVESWVGNPVLSSKIDKSSLAIGDVIEIFERFGLQVLGTATISDIDESDNSLTGLDNLNLTIDPNTKYDIRRAVKKAKTTGYSNVISLGDNENTYLTDSLNVYVDGNTEGYVASNSLPSYDISVELFKSSFETGNNNTLSQPQQVDPFDPSIAINYHQINFSSPTKFNTGDAVIYQAVDSVGAAATTLVGISTLNNDNTTRVFYVDVTSDKTGIKLHDSVGSIGISTIVLDKPDTFALGGVNHVFTLQDHYNRDLTYNPILRKFPLSQDLYVTELGEDATDNVGVLIDGVEIRSGLGEDAVEYGEISNIDIFNSGEGYDVCNPPKLVIEDPVVSGATTALAEPVVNGTVKEIIIETQNFDIDKCRSVSLTGGNGKGCLLEPEVGPRFREIKFNSQDVIFNGGVDPVEEIIAFEDPHKLFNGERIFYDSNGNDALGIGEFKTNSTVVTDFLVNGAAYFVKVLNPKNVRLFNSEIDALTGPNGINTIGLSTTSNGIHKFRTESKNTIKSVKVINPGTGYSYKKLIVKPVGISTAYDSIHFENHGFGEGDTVNYATMEYNGSSDPITGLSTYNEYTVIKIDDDTFRLSDNGVVDAPDWEEAKAYVVDDLVKESDNTYICVTNHTSSSTFMDDYSKWELTKKKDDYVRGKYVNLTSTGTGYHVFKYPDIKVKANVSFASTVTGEINFTPIVTGNIIGADLYEKGSYYGSETVNHDKGPDTDIQNGKEAELNAIVTGGRIVEVQVLNKGKEYFSLPEIKISGSGNGAKFKPVISNGKLIEVVVINPGIGYSAADTFAFADSRGKNGLIESRVKKLYLDDSFKHGEFHLEPHGDDKVTLSAHGYGATLQGAFDKLNTGGHSAIIGWAYDGNPIYGPYGFEEADKYGSTIKRMVSGYKPDSAKIGIDIAAGIRPSLAKFPIGSFINDWVYTNEGDLDDHNGRFCKTPEFPRGIYAYFATIDDNLQPVYPYFIGKTYRLPFIKDNNILDQSFDFNNSNLSRNTFPYKVNETFADNDFIIESNEIVRQMSTIESVTTGSVTDFQILDGGDGYKVGDFTVFDNTGTNGTGARAIVDEIVGLGVSTLKTEILKYENAVFTWDNDFQVSAHYRPEIEFGNNDSVVVSGLSTSNLALTDSFTIGVQSDKMTLVKELPANTNPNGTVEDIYVNTISDLVSVGSSITIDDEYLKVLNLYPIGSIIRVKRFTNAPIVSYGATINTVADKITIPVKSNKFPSRTNDLVYFNSTLSVGLGTTGGSSINYSIGENNNQVPIPAQSIYIPNHPFETGQKVFFRKDMLAQPAATSLMMSEQIDGSGIQNIPNISSGVSEMYIIDKGTDYIGLAFDAGKAHTTNGVFFYGTGSNSYEYSLESDYEQVTGDISRLATTVMTKVAAANTSTHGLSNGDVISLEVVPNLVVGYGNTEIIDVRYNSEFEKLTFNPQQFDYTGISTTSDSVDPNTITIVNHGYKTGDKVFYDSDDVIDGFEIGSYYIHEIDSSKFYLTETLKDAQDFPAKVIGITTVGSTTATHTFSIINPQITVVKNSTLTFGLSTATLSGFDFNLYYDKEFKNKFNNSDDSTEFNVSKSGTIGDTTVGAALSITFTKSTPTKLFYSLDKSGYISTADKDVPNYSEIIFVESKYNGDYQIFDVDNESFKISPRSVPELNEYKIEDCDKLEYSTKTSDVVGAIKGLRTISTGFSYKKAPKFSHVSSDNGRNANIVALSTSIGNINQLRINDIGFEYSADNTLRPEVFISPIINVDDLDEVGSINIINGGLNYLSSPDLLLYDPKSKKVVDSNSLVAIVPEQSISEVEIIAPIKGLSSVNHRIISINNSNGIGINSMTVESETVAVCYLQTPINGFKNAPFAEGDEIFVEGIQRVGEAGIGVSNTGATATTVVGEGFNSSDYDFTFFKVKSYTASNPDVLKFDLVGVTTFPGLPKVFQSGYANIVNRNVYPELQVVQNRSEFSIDESLSIKESGTFIKKDLKVVDFRDDFIKVDGKDELKVGDRFIGDVSGTSATVTSISNSKGKFNVDYSSRVDVGWNDDIGKLNEDYQVTPNNDYYQNLSYSVKSSITWDKFVDPVNRLVHPSGLKNFGDVVVQNSGSFAGVTTQSIEPTIVLDVTEERRVDTINNFDLVVDYDKLDNKSKFIEFQNVKLTDYTKCLTNRVLIHDDISHKFSSVGLQDLFTEIEEINGNFAKYLVQVVDPDTFDVQISDLVVLTTTEDASLLEKTSDFSNIKLGDFSTDADAERKALIFTPTDLYDKDHDIKVLKTTFSTDVPGGGVPSTNQTFGCVSLNGSNTTISSGTTSVTGTITETLVNGDYEYNLSVVDLDLNSTDAGYNKIIPDKIGSYLSSWETRQRSNGTTFRVGFAVTEITSSTTAKLIPVTEESISNVIVHAPLTNITEDTYSSVIVGTAGNIGFLDRDDQQPIVLGVTTTTIYSSPDNDFNGSLTDILILDNLRRDLTYNEVILNIDHTTDELQIIESVLDTGEFAITQDPIGIITARHENDTVYLDIINDRNSSLNAGVNVVGLGTTTAGIGTYRFNVTGQPEGSERSLRFESKYSGESGISTITRFNTSIDSALKSLIRVSCGETTVMHQVIMMQDQDGDAVVVEYPYITNKGNDGIGSFNTSNPESGIISFNFNPDAEYASSVVEVQAYNQIFQTVNDFENESDILHYGPIVNDLVLSAYDGPNGDRANKVNFELTHEETPIYYKRFNPSDSSQLNLTSGKFTLPNHFFNTNEELTYTPYSSFIGVPAIAPGIASTEGASGIINTLPEKVYVKAVSGSEFFLYSKKEFIEDGEPITFTNSGSGNAHKFQMSKVLSKTVIGLDGIVQQPISYTAVEHTLLDDVPSKVTAITPLILNATQNEGLNLEIEQFALSGISSVQPRDVLKVGDEYMKVIEVGVAESNIQMPVDGDFDDNGRWIPRLPTINSEDGTIAVVKVKRGTLGTYAQYHTAGTEVRVHRGSFNIVDSTVWFLDPPKGNTRQRRSETNLPYVRAEFSGRTFLRTNYDTNMVFDDISDSFTGIGRTYTLTVGGANTVTGVGVGNGILFINGVFQTPLTLNNLGNNYEFENDTNVGVSSVVFTGITSENGSRIQSEFDINQNQIPRGGLIVSLGSTPGLGYAPLVGARLKAEKNSSGTIDNLVGYAHSSLTNISIEDAVYDNVSGIITVTTNNQHNFSLDNPPTVLLNELEFECSSSYAGVTTTVFNDDNRSIPVVAITSERTFEAFCGVSTINHNYVSGGTFYSGGYVCEFYEDLTFGSGYREPVSIGVTDVSYDHTFVGSSANSITADDGSQYTPTRAEYESHTGNLRLTIGSHVLTSSNTITIAEESLTFRCSRDEFFSKHPYPRSTDPAGGNAVLNITDVSYDTILVNVGPGGGAGTDAVVTAVVADNTHQFDSATTNGLTDNTGATFTITDADYDPQSGIMTVTTSSVHGFAAADVTSVSDATYNPTTGIVTLQTANAHGFSNGDYIKVAEKSLVFTCTQDDNSSEHPYPRKTDPIFNKWIQISNVTSNTFDIQVLLNLPSSNTTVHTLVSSEPNNIQKANNLVEFAQESIVFRCNKDRYATVHAYPRISDPIFALMVGVEGINPLNNQQFIINVGKSPAGTGGSLEFTIQNGGTGYVNPEILTPDPVYQNMSIEGISRLSVGSTTECGANLLLDIEVDTSPAPGITTSLTPTGASYNPTTGILGLTFDSTHLSDSEIKNGEMITIATDSLSFRCDMGSNDIKTYPRSGDPACKKDLKVTNLSSTGFDVQIGRSPIVNYDVSDASYNGTTGKMVLTIGANHGLKKGTSIKLADESIAFDCGYNGGGTESYPRTTIDTHTAQAGTSYDPINGILTVTTTSPHNMRNGDWVKIADNALSFTCTYGTGQHIYVGGTLVDGLKVTPAGSPFDQNRTITDAQYDPSTGLLILEIGSHVYSTNDYAEIVTPMDFTCSADGHSTIHPYPRLVNGSNGNSDPAYQTSLQITAVGSTTITLNVGAVTDSSRTKTYPRSTDPISGKWIRVYDASGSTFKLDVLQGDESTNSSNHDFVGCVADAISQKRDRAYDAPIEILSANQAAGTITLQVGKTGNTDVHTFNSGSTTAGAVISGGNYNHTFIKSNPDSITRGYNSNNQLHSIQNFKVSRPGHSFSIGDKFKVVGLVTSALVHEPVHEFQLNVARTSNDFFSAWQFGEIDFIDNIKFMQDGTRRRYPLFLNGQLLSFEKDETDPLSAQIDLNAILLIFVNGVIQTPDIAYQFFGGTSFTFTEPPDEGDKVDIFFYKGQDGVDIKIVDIEESIKRGDEVKINKHRSIAGTKDQVEERTIKDILSSDLVETDVYTGPGINENDFKPLDWIKQKRDKFINGEIVSKARDSIEPQIYPTAKIIGDFTNTTTGKDGIDYGIFVDDAHVFQYEDLSNPNIDPGDRYSINVDQVDAIIYSPENNDFEEANITAAVGNDGTVGSLTVVNGGNGYDSGSINLLIGAPIGVGVGTINREEFEVAGVSEFAKATATVVNGSIDPSTVLITDAGKGYSVSNPPQVIVPSEATDFEKITKITNVQGWTGIITKIEATTGTNGNAALKFEFQVETNQLASDLLVGYPVFIHDTQIGDGVISIDADDASVVGVGTTFLDTVYKVHQIQAVQRTGIITCNVSSTSNISGLIQEGQYDQTNLGITTSLGRISWGRLYNPLDGIVRDADNPLTLTVSGKTTNSGLSTFPTIQRRTFDPSSHKGLRNTGAIRTIV